MCSLDGLCRTDGRRPLCSMNWSIVVSHARPRTLRAQAVRRRTHSTHNPHTGEAGSFPVSGPGRIYVTTVKPALPGGLR